MICTSDPRLLAQVSNGIGRLSLNRPSAMNALDLGLVRALYKVLQDWQGDDSVHEVRVRGIGKNGPFGVFCAGGDIRFFHEAALTGNPRLEDFFTEEYRLNHLIYHYPKPYVAFMDGVVMGGGMGISQGARWRLVTERTKMAMPETLIGLFPDVAGGFFLSRCPGFFGEYLALTGHVLNAVEAIALGLADQALPSAALQAVWDDPHLLKPDGISPVWPSLQQEDSLSPVAPLINQYFSGESACAIVKALEAAESDWAQKIAKLLRHRSPLMLDVTLSQIRRARNLSIADALRLERDLVRHCFDTAHLSRRGAASETVEGIRALAIDKDHQPQWRPELLEQVTPEMTQPFFVSPWPAAVHPLADL